jgi:hypothetical protein
VLEFTESHATARRGKLESELPSELPSIQLVFVSPNGVQELGPLITPRNEPLEQFDAASWDLERCAEELQRRVRRKDDRGIEAVMSAMDRLDCWRASFCRLMDLPTPDAELGEGLLWFWVTYGFHISESLAGDAIFVDALRRLVPPHEGEPMPLYRGELRSRHLLGVYGIAWTAKLDIAEMFARRRVALQEGPGVVLQIEASPDTIVCARPAHSNKLGEEEYLVDPRTIHSIKVLKEFR